MCLELPLVSLVTSHLTVTGTHASLCVTHWAGQCGHQWTFATPGPGLKYQDNCGKRGILITKAEIFEVTNVSVLYSSSLPWPNVVV